MQHLHRDAVALLTGWRPPDSHQAELRADYLTFLATHRNAVERGCRAGHLTASALVVNPQRDAVLLTLHPKVGRWLQLGGHIEPVDQSVRDAAVREAFEESGHMPMTMSIEPVRLDHHSVPCAGSWSAHLDVQFIATISSDAVPIGDAPDVAWFPIDRAPGDGSVQALIAAARAGYDTQVTVP
jgi:8-oxo-dGTP pyrophosphatase MutT (NUDIX family)